MGQADSREVAQDTQGFQPLLASDPTSSISTDISDYSFLSDSSSQHSKQKPGTKRSSTFDHCIKLIIIGPSGSGKTSLLNNFQTRKFTEDQGHTIGVEFSSKYIMLGDKRVKLQLWDTAGQERYRSVTKSYYNAVAGVALVYDICDKSSFESMNTWMDDIRLLAPPDVIILICANKVDLEESRQISSEEGMEYAKENGALYIETSAKDHDTVLEAFTILTQEVLQKMEDKPESQKSSDDTTVIDQEDLAQPASQSSYSSESRCAC